MPYTPKSRIQTNLYTDGKEYTLKVEGPEDPGYVGYYHKLYNGKIYTGKNQDDKPNFPLYPIPFNDGKAIYGLSTLPISNLILDGDSNVANYLNLKNLSSDSVHPSPQPYLTIPTEQDYKLGEFRRYFCKKRNEFIYLEISISDYNKIINRDPTIDFTSWFPFNIPWSLTGDKDKVGQTNKNIVLLQINRNKLYGFDKYLKGDYLKYYKA
jgi:hypothetical protein